MRISLFDNRAEENLIMLESFKSSNFEYKKLTEEEQRKRGILGRLVGPIADFKNPTRNGRKYTEKLWEKVFSDPIVKEKIDNKCLYGELGHPIDERLETDMTKICCCMSEQPKKSPDGKLYGVVDVIDTPNGRILKTLLEYGATVGISSRGEGDIINDGYMGEEIVDPDTYQFEAFDIVLVPAVKSARLTSVTESFNSNKSLKQALLEDLNKSNDNDRLVMNDTLESLGIKLNEDFDDDGELEHDAKHYDAISMEKAKRSLKLIKQFYTDDEFKQWLDMCCEYFGEENRDEFLSYINESLTEKLSYAGYDVELTSSGVRLSNGKFTKEFNSLDSAIEFAQKKPLDESGELKKSSIKDVNIQKGSEKEEADNDGDDLVTELQETLLKNADLEKLVKNLQERLSVCYAKEKRHEGQIGTYKSSIKSLQENTKKATSLEVKIKYLEEELEKCKSRIEKKDSRITFLNESLNEQVKENDLKEKRISDIKSLTREMTAKIKSLQEELENSKESKVSSIGALKESYSKKEESYKSKIGDLQKDSLIKQKQLEEKLSKLNEEVDRYKAIAKKAIDKYVTEKANALGISADDVKNRLGKSYSFNDINSICESLSSNKIAIERLPFRTSQINHMSSVKESLPEKPSINQFQDGDYVDDQLLGLMKWLP